MRERKRGRERGRNREGGERESGGASGGERERERGARNLLNANIIFLRDQFLILISCGHQLKLHKSMCQFSKYVMLADLYCNYVNISS